MTHPWTGELFRAGALVGLAALLGLLLGSPLLTVCAALALVLLGHARQAWLFLRFLDNPLRPPRRLSGFWEEAAYRIYYRHRRARARMRRVLAVTRRFLNSTEALPDGAAVIDGRGDIQWFNRTAGRLLGLKRSDLGRNLPSLLRHPLIQRLLDGELPDDTAEIPSLRDEEAVLEVRVVSFGDDDRLFLARDTTQVQRLLTMRQDFVANVSHELRTPLTVIVGYLEALSDVETPDAETVDTLLRRLEKPTLRMRSLVEELLLLSRLDTSAMPSPADLDPVDVASVLRGIVAEARQMCGDDHELLLETEPGIRVLGIERELHSAFMNLVVNAIRYSPDGGRIEVRWQRTEAGGARFSVRDEGIGIAEEHISRLTERFYRVDVGRSRDAGGTGLGLAIVKHVLRRHQSELKVESRLGVGSTFSCELPPRLLREPELRDRGTTRTEDRGAAEPGRRGGRRRSDSLAGA